ncbi:hypothetical protein B0A49_01998 [Cryomyces minteri]|uniref:Pre-rRNA-processing protein n=1 Tax=Cryomyces minteri TaxID=331657 RepID=A0A4U0X9L1_9PEZI|nr:hypothetical protein B0A49_04353 [Cryomyces minteri]TKA76295.1 hypothetical protein B0A49_01998 [Cryomyces minteri]
MGSSAKRKKEKKKDFQKPKLKVGKARPKAANATDTSFRAKSIVLNQQSIHSAAPTSTAQFEHTLSLLSSKSDTQRRDALSYLTTSTSAAFAAGQPLPQSVSIILPRLHSLLLDGSTAVRQQLLKLLAALPGAEVSSHEVEQLLLYVRAGMTHLAADIRTSSLEALDWLVAVQGEVVVSCAGGWVKTLRILLGLLAWKVPSKPGDNSSGSGDGGKWTSVPKATFGKVGGEAKMQIKLLNSLALFLRAGLAVPAAQQNSPRYHPDHAAPWGFPLRHTECHMLPTRSNPFGHLNLFGAPRDAESEMFEDREDRQRWYAENVGEAVEAGLEGARKEAGEVGRAAAGVKKVVAEGMREFTLDG